MTLSSSVLGTGVGILVGLLAGCLAEEELRLRENWLKHCLVAVAVVLGQHGVAASGHEVGLLTTLGIDVVTGPAPLSPLDLGGHLQLHHWNSAAQFAHRFGAQQQYRTQDLPAPRFDMDANLSRGAALPPLPRKAWPAHDCGLPRLDAAALSREGFQRRFVGPQRPAILYNVYGTAWRPHNVSAQRLVEVLLHAAASDGALPTEGGDGEDGAKAEYRRAANAYMRGISECEEAMGVAQQKAADAEKQLACLREEAMRGCRRWMV